MQEAEHKCMREDQASSRYCVPFSFHIRSGYVSKGILKYRCSFNNAFQVIPVLILLCGVLFKTSHGLECSG